MQIGGRWYLGRRGMMLLLLGGLWIWLGLNVPMTPAHVPGLWHTFIWEPVWIAEWVVPGLVALVFAWRTVDWPGWALLMLAPIIRASSLISGWVMWMLPDGIEGYPMGLWQSILYLFMIGVVGICAGWPDYPPRDERMPQTDLWSEND